MVCMPHETSRVINQKKQIRPNFSGSHTFPLKVPAGMLFSKRNENRAGSQVACEQRKQETSARKQDLRLAGNRAAAELQCMQYQQSNNQSIDEVTIGGTGAKVACSRLRDGGGKLSFSKKKCEKFAGAGERQSGRARLIFALLVLIRFHYTVLLVQASAKGSFQIALAIRTVPPKNATFIPMFLLNIILSLDYK